MSARGLLATGSKAAISFNMLHEKDLSRIQMKIWCPVDEEVISRGDTVRGYEYRPDQYVEAKREASTEEPDAAPSRPARRRRSA